MSGTTAFWYASRATGIVSLLLLIYLKGQP